MSTDSHRDPLGDALGELGQDIQWSTDQKKMSGYYQQGCERVYHLRRGRRLAAAALGVFLGVGFALTNIMQEPRPAEFTPIASHQEAILSEPQQEVYSHLASLLEEEVEADLSDMAFIPLEDSDWDY